jgi:hypothetical protein
MYRRYVPTVPPASRKSTKLDAGMHERSVPPPIREPEATDASVTRASQVRGVPRR